MAFPQSVDFDILSGSVIHDLQTAIDGWLKGRPLDETSLQNRITERLVRRRTNCDIGVERSATVQCEIYELHRKGPRTTDQFGSDLAISVSIPEENFLKTAFFQFKLSHEMKTVVEKKQIEDALFDERVGKRSFVFCVDVERRRIRIFPVNLLENEISGISSTLDCSNWASAGEFLHDWFACFIGFPSDAQDPRAVEKLLENFVIPDHSPLRNFEEGIYSFDSSGYVPARNWAKFEIAPKRTKK